MDTGEGFRGHLPGCGTRTRPGTRRHLLLPHRPLRGRAAPHASGHGRAAGGFEGPRLRRMGSDQLVALRPSTWPSRSTRALNSCCRGTVVSGVEKMVAERRHLRAGSPDLFPGLHGRARCVLRRHRQEHRRRQRGRQSTASFFENALQARESLAELRRTSVSRQTLHRGS